MPVYRVYTLNEHNRISGPAKEVVCVDDDDAGQFAQTVMAAGGNIEVWLGAQKIFCPGDGPQRNNPPAESRS